MNRLIEAKALFDRIVALTPEERKTCLEEACSGDDQMRDFMIQLLSAYDDGLGDFLLSPPAEISLDERCDDPSEIGGYTVVRRIGEGGMGVVYEAKQERPRRTVALKVIRASSPSQKRDASLRA